MKDKFYYKDGSVLDCDTSSKTLHREGAPAIEWANGTKHWYINGKRHREGAPAIELANGDKYWYINGKLHREDGPAVEFADGTKEWFLNDKQIENPLCQAFEIVSSHLNSSQIALLQLSDNPLIRNLAVEVIKQRDDNNE